MADNNQLNNGDLLNKQKPKTLKGRRIIKDKSAKLRENPKKLLIFLNKGCKEAVNGFFRDLVIIFLVSYFFLFKQTNLF